MNYAPVVLIAVFVIIVYVYMRTRSKSNVSVSGKTKGYQSIDDEFNAKKKAKQQEIDRILEKIHRKGVDSLSKREKILLDEHSNSNIN